MFVRVVRFKDVDPQRLDQLLSRIDESEGPPEGVPSMALKIMVDEGQRTAVVLQYFDSAEDMATAAKVLEEMDPSETPGTRVSVDACEMKLELSAS